LAKIEIVYTNSKVKMRIVFPILSKLKEKGLGGFPSPSHKK